MSERGPCSTGPPDIHTTNPWVSFFRNGPLLGAAGSVLIYMVSRVTSDEPKALPLLNDEIPTSLLASLHETIAATQFHILAWYLMIGAIAGAAAWMFWAIWSAAREQSMPTGKALLGRILIVLACAHTWVSIRAIALAPDAMTNLSTGGLWGGVFTPMGQALPTSMIGYVDWAIVLVVLAVAGLALKRLGFDALKDVLKARRWALPACAVLACLSLVWFLRTNSFASPPKTTDNLVIIVIDSLRADRIDAVDARGVEHMPRITQFAQDALSFDNAWTVVPGELPAWVSLVTGQYPQTHGIRHDFPNTDALAHQRSTLFRTLGEQRWRTGVIAGNVGSPLTRLDLGFENIRAPRAAGHSSVELATYKAHPHLMAYVLPWSEHTEHLPILKRIDTPNSPEGITNEALSWIAQGDGRSFGVVIAYSSPARSHGEPMGEATQSHYNQTMKTIDRSVGLLLDQLQEWNLTDQTHVILTSNHGTHLGEADFGHGHMEHLYGQHALRIPLLIRSADGAHAGQSSNGVARNIDVAPTALAMLGLSPLSKADGANLLHDIKNDQKPTRNHAFIESPTPKIPSTQTSERVGTLTAIDLATGLRLQDDPLELVLSSDLEDDVLAVKQRAMIAGNYKLVYTPKRSGVTWELFNMQADPKEQQNLITKERGRFNALRAQLIEWVLQDPAMTVVGDYLLPKSPSPSQ